MATAVSWLDKAVAMAGERAALMDRAEAHLVTGGAGTAVGAYEMLLARDDLDSGTRLEIVWMLARAEATAGRQDMAAATFEHAATMAASRPTASRCFATEPSMIATTTLPWGVTVLGMLDQDRTGIEQVEALALCVLL